MIKGINRQMIEVTHTGSPYFERAFLVVRPGCSQSSEQAMNAMADKVVEQASTYSGLRRQKRRLLLKRILWTMGAAAGGAGIMWAFLYFL